METIQEIVRKATFEDDDPWQPRRPRVNEFVNCRESYGSDACLARVKRQDAEGTLVEVWSRNHRGFIREVLIPAGEVGLIYSRCSISEYSLTGEF